MMFYGFVSPRFDRDTDDEPPPKREKKKKEPDKRAKSAKK